jgi:hypothetical protein
LFDCFDAAVAIEQLYQESGYQFAGGSGSSSIAMTPDCRVAAVNKPTSPFVRNLESGRTIALNPPDAARVEDFSFSVDLSADGRRLLTCGHGDGACYWNAEDGELLATLYGPPRVQYVDISARGDRVFTSNREKSLLWSLEDAGG